MSEVLVPFSYCTSRHVVFRIIGVRWEASSVHDLIIGLSSVCEVPHEDDKPLVLDVGVGEHRVGPEAGLAGGARAVGALPVQPRPVPPEVVVDDDAAGPADALEGDDGHLLEEQDGGGEGNHALGEHPLAGPEWGPHVHSPTSSRRQTCSLV